LSEEVVLTVSESKRLIAKGVTKLPEVKRTLECGIIALAKGTTNRYIAEELLGENLSRYPYAHIVVSPGEKGGIQLDEDIDEIVLVRGKPRKITLQQATMLMKKGDIFVKGGNLLNYDKGKVGILSGTLDGGTIGRAMGSILARRITLLIPIGLEKSVSEDIDELSLELGRADLQTVIFPVRGKIFTEIEALRCLAGVRAFQIGAGGILGAEGSVRLALEGSADELRLAREAIHSIRGERPYSWVGSMGNARWGK